MLENNYCATYGHYYPRYCTVSYKIFGNNLYNLESCKYNDLEQTMLNKYLTFKGTYQVLEIINL